MVRSIIVTLTSEILGFWATILAIESPFVGGLLAWYMAAAFQWIGYILALSLFLGPAFLILWKRERRSSMHGEFDDKRFGRITIEEVFRKDVED